MRVILLNLHVPVLLPTRSSLAGLAPYPLVTLFQPRVQYAFTTASMMITVTQTHSTPHMERRIPSHHHSAYATPTPAGTDSTCSPTHNALAHGILPRNPPPTISMRASFLPRRPQTTNALRNLQRARCKPSAFGTARALYTQELEPRDRLQRPRDPGLGSAINGPVSGRCTLAWWARTPRHGFRWITVLIASR